MDQRIRLDKALLLQGMCSTRTEAKNLIEEGAVLVDGLVCDKVAKMVSIEAKLILQKTKKFVSRGGDKLEGALVDIFGTEKEAQIQIEGKQILDIGASTGGFTDCLLRYGAEHVDAVDVGSSQLHPILQQNKKVSSFEHQDIRAFIARHTYDVIVCDMSFISTIELLPQVTSFRNQKTNTHIFILIKPQFEVGKGNTKKGVVKNATLTQLVLEKAKEKTKELGFMDTTIVPSKISGGDGNQEYFLYIRT